MSMSSIVRTLAFALAIGWTPALAASVCTADSGARAFQPGNHQACTALWTALKTFKHDPVHDLPGYERDLSSYYTLFCYRDPQGPAMSYKPAKGAAQTAHWVHDKYVRDTGPEIAAISKGQWSATPFGTHAPVMIWYSPEIVVWLKNGRKGPIPDGAMMIKEMYPAPALACRNVDPLNLKPPSDYGAAIMVRDNKAAHDGWFWGWYGWGKDSGWKPDWLPNPSVNNPPMMGFGQYCVNCHASAVDKLSFADLRNIAGEPGTPIPFLAQNFFVTPPPPSMGATSSATPESSAEEHKPLAVGELANLEGGKRSHDQLVVSMEGELKNLEQKQTPPESGRDVIAALGFAVPPAWTQDPNSMPSQGFDNVWVGGGAPGLPTVPHPANTFLTSSQCVGCHDAGSTGLQFDMTVPNPDLDPANPTVAYLLNQSPYATWRTSPMGLAGRDPFFFAQLASETQTFHPFQKDFVEDTCLGCHGIMGQRQFHIDTSGKPVKHGGPDICLPFMRGMVDKTPWPADLKDQHAAVYGALARDGISCTACHRMNLTATAASPDALKPENACIVKRQQDLNPDFTGFAKTFTGSFFVGPPDRLIGPFDKPLTKPMVHAFGNTPVMDANHILTDSRLCGTCHSVHLPVYADQAPSGAHDLGHVFEQTTYSEWEFSAFQTGFLGDKTHPLAGGAKSCQDCHMPSTEADGSATQSRIASIQEHSRFPDADHALGADDLDVPIRSGFARHLLVGLNVYLATAAKQYPDVLGISSIDPMLTKKGVNPIDATVRAMLQSARDTATVNVDAPILSKSSLDVVVRIVSKVGHKFPSGVGFRRAFVDFKVSDAKGTVLWESGRTNPAGMIVDPQGRPIAGEVWWKPNCSGRLDPDKQSHQPHYQVIDAQDEAQIYQELVTAPPPNATKATCGREPHDKPAGALTTSFLSICGVVKDNRILPAGFLPLAEREALARAEGAGDGKSLAVDAGPDGVGDDPDYVHGGGDSLRYSVPLSALNGATPAKIEATLYYQATPPFYLQDRMCTAKGADRDRLAYLIDHMDMDKSPAPGWKLRVAGSGPVGVSATSARLTPPPGDDQTSASRPDGPRRSRR